MNILVIPDTHVKPGENLGRFDWMYNLTLNIKISHVVHLGDLLDMPSLCRYDQDHSNFKKRNISNDIESGNYVFEKLFDIQNDGAIVTVLGGNHDEERISRLLRNDERFVNSIPTYKSVVEGEGLTYVPYQENFTLGGVNFSHHFPSGVLGKPISGENPASTLIKKMHKSCVVGHQHTLDYAERVAVDGQRLHGYVAGCFIDPKWKASYAGAAQKMWRNGLSILHNVKNGSFDLEFISIERLKEQYS